ncbi:uncharacterized protein LOC116034497 isoform X2 [Sander lucioperca]|uniref:uncharacterized protein LOC116034497 isoform X2 n=1 Tax=Sander lucioperca TaxID=283035 RepID=UPI001653AFF5|nr:uncharacterized protein LOC116034497 isoform X2 [Sander lucioperca]
MAPQLYITMYKEQFASPGRPKREQLRPTSAHRRNNPQPRPDFLFPRSLQANYRSCRTLPHSPVDIGRPLFPPVKHLSFHSPITTFPHNYLNTANTGKPNRMPPVNPSTAQAPPSADGLQKLQLNEPPAGFKLHAALKNPARMDYQRNVHPLSAQQLRQHAGAQIRTRPQTSNPQHHFPGTQYWSGCYSCFHVVKPYQAGHYIIHPEFVSECQC